MGDRQKFAKEAGRCLRSALCDAGGFKMALGHVSKGRQYAWELGGRSVGHSFSRRQVQMHEVCFFVLYVLAVLAWRCLLCFVYSRWRCSSVSQRQLCLSGLRCWRVLHPNHSGAETRTVSARPGSHEPKRWIDSARFATRTVQGLLARLPGSRGRVLAERRCFFPVVPAVSVE